jgi:hypothetical protein
VDHQGASAKAIHESPRMITNPFATSGRYGCDRPDLTRYEQILVELRAPGLRLGPLIDFDNSEKLEYARKIR